ncbi:hypothetical protein [Candidatus Poriferisodalis sp.]|uniref:hypothetical protein n=1 Tax=Candidatus Poriferisodalis sp. TaxID=3101277 RepID=UPI003B5CC691
MQEREATFTLEDRDSPDLLAVVADISRDRHGKQRRRRASALLSALGRAWDRQLSDYAEVDAASDYYGWNLKGKIPAFWLAQAGDVAWLDDESGKARRPAELRVRTPGTEALYGRDSSDYLHADLDQQTRRTFLAALGISGDPSRSELVGRLRDLQSMPRPSQTVSNSLRQESETVYRALARSPAPGSTDSDLNRRQLRREFARHRLILVDESWLAPSAVFAGPPIFGDLRPFAPATRECELLWRELGLKTPSAKDCVAVIKELTYRRRRGPDRTEQAVLLETMRTLAEQLAQGDIVQREKLRRLALWTSTGWERDRPVYVTDNPVLAAGLGDRLSIWQPGGELEQFRSLLEPLRVSEIRADDSRVTDPEFALLDHSLTEHFRRALALLRDELQRNLPDLAHGITTSWDDLAEHAVKVHPTLQLTVCLTTGDEYSCATNAIVDSALATVFVADAAALGHVDGGGRALAALFEVERRRVALEWSAACDRAAEGSDVLSIELARDRVAREEREFGDRSRLVSTPINAGRDNRVVTRPADRGEAIDENGEQSASHFAGAPRTLVDPELYEIVDTEGRVIQGQQARRPSVERNMARGSGELVEPIRISRAPQSRLPLRGFSGVDRENVGFEFFRTALGSNGREIIDVRTQRNVGADAVDEYDNFYELKVFAGPEPNDVTLTASEVQRARTAQSFFLVVVSSIEGDGARPTVRLIADPLQRLHPTDRGTITLSGVRELDNPVYKFASVADQ